MKTKLLLSTLLLCNNVVAQVNDSLVQSRLDTIPSSIPLDYNTDVKLKIEAFVRNYDNKTSIALERFFRIDSSLIDVFNENNVPIELRYACISLTGCDNFYHTTEGKKGYFKMKYNVAKSNGLYVSNFVDERKDKLRAAKAFCLELNRIYVLCNNWQEAYTRYCGGNLEWQKALTLIKDSTYGFWDVNNALPSRYKEEYPKLIAAMYIANYYLNHRIIVKSDNIITENVLVSDYLPLYRVSRILNIDHNFLQQLNPIYKKGFIPNSGKTYYLTLPIEYVDAFYEKGDTIYGDAYAAVDSFSNLKSNEIITPKSVMVEKPKINVRYTVKRGDALSLIADYFDCTMSEVKRWNGIRGSRIYANQRLTLKVPASKASYYRKINSMSLDQKKRIARKD